eukprot:1124864-Pelagomonas_calceolata.AAC.4
MVRKDGVLYGVNAYSSLQCNSKPYSPVGRSQRNSSQATVELFSLNYKQHRCALLKSQTTRIGQFCIHTYRAKYRSPCKNQHFLPCAVTARTKRYEWSGAPPSKPPPSPGTAPHTAAPCTAAPSLLAAPQVLHHAASAGQARARKGHGKLAGSSSSSSSEKGSTSSSKEQ